MGEPKTTRGEGEVSEQERKKENAHFHENADQTKRVHRKERDWREATEVLSWETGGGKEPLPDKERGKIVAATTGSGQGGWGSEDPPKYTEGGRNKTEEARGNDHSGRGGSKREAVKPGKKRS